MKFVLALLFSLKRRLYILVGWLGGVTWLMGAERVVPAYTLRVWETDDGLPHSSVQAMTQTRDGYIWVGTQEGLARFDGSRFVVFDQKNVPEIKARSVMALVEAADGALWIGTDGGGVVVRRGEKFFHYGKTNGLAGDAVRAMLVGKDGSVWIGTTTGLTRYQDGQFKSFGEAEGLCHGIVRGLCEDHDGTLWIAASRCLTAFKQGVFTNITMKSGLLDISVRSVQAGREGGLWVGSDNGVTRRKDGGATLLAKPEGLTVGFVVAIYEDRQGVVWLGGYSGLEQIVNGKIVSEMTDAGVFSTLVYCIMEDREGNIWVGHKEGLTRFSAKRCWSYTKQQGLPHNAVVAVCPDVRGALWIATWGGGLCRFQDGVFSPVEFSGFSFHKLALALHASRDGSIWMGADYDGGLFRWTPERTERLTRGEGLRAAEVTVVYEDSRTNLWIGSKSLLNRYAHGSFSTYTTQEGLAGNFIRAIMEDRAGNVWLATDGGLSRWREGAFVNFTTKDGLSHPTLSALHEDREQTLWIGTRGGGLNRFKAGKFTAWSQAEGLPHDFVHEILEDDAGWLWISHPKGIYCVSKKELEDQANGLVRRVHGISYGKTDGMVSTDCKGVAKPSGCRGPDGKFWFPTARGLVAVDPKIKVTEPPPVYIEEVAIAGVKQNLAEPIRVTGGRQQVSIHYTALSYAAPEKIAFKYRLQGVDRHWVEAGNRREANYTHLSAGAYRFQVMAANGDGVWNHIGSSVAFTLVPPFWMTWWFVGLAGLSGFGALVGGVHFVSVKKMQRRLRQLEQQHAVEKERLRIARDMHDDLGGSLTQISILSDLARRDLAQPGLAEAHIHKIAESARQTTRSLEEIVWAVHPENDTLDHLANYLCQFAEEFFHHTPVRCRVDLPSFIPPRPLSAELRHNLFLIVKESMNNTLKYADATEVWLRLRVVPESFTIWVEDNGRGFDVEKNAAVGNGIRNLHKRAADVGGHLQISSALGQGTKMQVTVDWPPR